MYSLSEVFKTLRAQGLSGLAESSRWAFEMQRASYKTHCDSLFSWWKKGKEKKRKKKKKNVTRLSEASRADNKQNSSLWVSLEMWEAFKTFLKLSGKEKKSLLKGCSNLFYCGLFISGEKAVTRRSPTGHQPRQGLPGFGGGLWCGGLAEREWGYLWQKGERLLALVHSSGRGSLSTTSSALLTAHQTHLITSLLNECVIEPTNQINRALKLLPHFGWPTCAPNLLAPSTVSSEVLSQPPTTSPALWAYTSLFLFLSLPSADDISPLVTVNSGTWLNISPAPIPALVLGILTPTGTIQIPDSLLQSPALLQQKARISSPQESHILTRPFYPSTSLLLPHSHRDWFLTLWRPSILGPFLMQQAHHSLLGSLLFLTLTLWSISLKNFFHLRSSSA